jgi:hypothetical protein
MPAIHAVNKTVFLLVGLRRRLTLSTRIATPMNNGPVCGAETFSAGAAGGLWGSTVLCYGAEVESISRVPS